jgi:hypothetical protein
MNWLCRIGFHKFYWSPIRDERFCARQGCEAVEQFIKVVGTAKGKTGYVIKTVRSKIKRTKR